MGLQLATMRQIVKRGAIFPTRKNLSSSGRELRTTYRSPDVSPESPISEQTGPEGAGVPPEDLPDLTQPPVGRTYTPEGDLPEERRGARDEGESGEPQSSDVTVSGRALPVSRGTSRLSRLYK